MTALRDGVRGKDNGCPDQISMELRWRHLIDGIRILMETAHEILQDERNAKMIVVIICFMTSSAKYADILLPDVCDRRTGRYHPQ